MRDKTLNKDTKLTVRLTPHLSNMLEVMTKNIGITKSTLIRYMIDQFIAQYDEADGL